ncbi:MAG TPA: hypothetical protein VGD88_17810 [Opitutaceae bacterium]
MANPVRAEELQLKPLAPTIERLEKSQDPDPSELAYVAARGAALFVAMSGYLNKNAADDRDRKISDDLFEKAKPYYVSAQIIGTSTGKTKETVDQQIKLIVDAYSVMMVKSKQLNNTIVSPQIESDMEALKRLETTFVEFAKETQGK